MPNKNFVNALERKPQKVPPIWMMRQAGRYHSHYQSLKKTHTFEELCKSPALAAETAMGPIEDFDFDEDAFLAALEQATGQLPRFDIVLDANIAIGDLLHKHQNPHLEQTALQEVVKSGVVRLCDPVGKAIRRLSYLTRDLIKRRKS